MRQGTGPFVAEAFADMGCPVAGVVGTSAESAAEAAQALQVKLDQPVLGFVDLRQAVLSTGADLVALCSPYAVHAEQLLQISSLNCHCLVEKPIVWPQTLQALRAIIDAFAERGRFLQVVNQWVHSLPVFAQIYPQQTPRKKFAMRLSPVSEGADMLIDAAPHWLNLVQYLIGPGRIEHVELPRWQPRHIIVHCQVKHDRGVLEASLELVTCPERPRPVWYAIDDQRVERDVELPAYQQFLVGNGRRVKLRDPLLEVVEKFLRDVSMQTPIDRAGIEHGHLGLQELMLAQP